MFRWLEKLFGGKRSAEHDLRSVFKRVDMVSDWERRMGGRLNRTSEAWTRTMLVVCAICCVVGTKLAPRR